MQVTASLITAAALVFGCADALPRQRPEGELASALKSAEEFAAQAERNAVSAKAERERAEQLYAEMESLRGRIEAADARCANGLRKVVDARSRAERVFLQRAAQAKKAKKVSAEVEVKAATTPAATPTPVEPEYSPSDAPLGNAAKPAAVQAPVAPAPVSPAPAAKESAPSAHPEAAHGEAAHADAPHHEESHH